MGRPELFTPQEIINALERFHGLVYMTARQLKCAPQTIYEYAERYPAIKQAMKDIREHSGDVAEDRLLRAMDKGDAWAIKFYLATIHKGRGYVERTEQVLSGDVGPTVLNVKVEAVDAGNRQDNPALPEANPVLPESSEIP